MCVNYVFTILLQMKCESFKFNNKEIYLYECNKNVENMNIKLTLKMVGHI